LNQQGVPGRAKTEGKCWLHPGVVNFDTCRDKCRMSRQSFRDRSVAKQSPSVFNQLPRPRLQRLFGRRSALFTGVERDRLLERRRNMTTETGVQRKLILAGAIIELWMPHAMRLQESKITKMFQRAAAFSWPRLAASTFPAL